jgi:hypothetical protein
MLIWNVNQSQSQLLHGLKVAHASHRGPKPPATPASMALRDLTNRSPRELLSRKIPFPPLPPLLSSFLLLIGNHPHSRIARITCRTHGPGPETKSARSPPLRVTPPQSGPAVAPPPLPLTITTTPPAPLPSKPKLHPLTNVSSSTPPPPLSPTHLSPISNTGSANPNPGVLPPRPALTTMRSASQSQTTEAL